MQNSELNIFFKSIFKKSAFIKFNSLPNFSFKRQTISVSISTKLRSKSFFTNSVVSTPVPGPTSSTGNPLKFCKESTILMAMFLSAKKC